MSFSINFEYLPIILTQINDIHVIGICCDLTIGILCINQTTAHIHFYRLECISIIYRTDYRIILVINIDHRSSILTTTQRKVIDSGTSAGIICGIGRDIDRGATKILNTIERTTVLIVHQIPVTGTYIGFGIACTP